MAARLKRYLKKEIDSGKVDLPEELWFLAGVSFHAIAEQRVQYERNWYVEIKGSSLKTLLDAKKKLNAARLSNREQTAQLIRLQGEKTVLAAASDNVGTLEVERDKAREELLTKESANESLVGDVKQLKEHINRLEEHIVALNQANDKLMENSEADDRPPPDILSPKTSFAMIDERGTLLRGPALQGGKAGGGKR